MCEMNERDMLAALEKLAAVQPQDQSVQRAQSRVREALATEFTEAFSAVPGFEPAPSRRKIMHWNRLKWAIPVAAAAAILLVVGLWPSGHARNGKPQSGHLYAFSEVPALIRSAQTFHIHGVQRWLASDKEVEVPIQEWHAASGASRIIGVKANDSRVSLIDVVCDGTYKMVADRASKSVVFERITPLQQRVIFLASMQQMLFGDFFCHDSSARTGTETIDGRVCELWESKAAGHSYKCWFDPSTGVLAKAEVLVKDSATGQVRQTFLLDKVERDIDPPAGIFDTTPPAGYKLSNTKETAPQGKLAYARFLGKTLETTVHIGFVLPDGSVVLPWSVRELGKDEPQDSLFAGLVAGGELPKLPLEVYGLTPQGATKPTYLGWHLAWTRKDGRCFEWALYVPDKDLLDPISYFSLLTRPNPAERDLKGNGSPGYPPCAIEVTAGDFDELVLGAMAELSDSGAAPAGITYEGVTRLAQQIRASLGSR